MQTHKSVVVMLTVFAFAQLSARQQNVTEALDGTDPVLLVQGKDVLGKPEFRALHEGLEYLFASAETKAEFEKNPGKYAVQFGGLCARMGRTASGNLSDYLVHEGKIYVFGSDDCHKAFAAAPAKYLPPAPEPMPSDARARQQGRARLDRAAAAIGGARLDEMTSYAETAIRIVRRMEAEIPETIRTIWRFPDAVRAERSLTLEGRLRSAATLITREGGWYVSEGRSYPMVAAARANGAIEQERQLVPLLRARTGRGVALAALGRGTIEGIDVERVRVRRGGLDVTLGLDPSSARPRVLTYVDRNNQGEFGAFTILYDDYQATAGFNVPFRIKALFNEKPEESQTLTVSNIEINPTVDGSLFNPPPGR
ncbi:MAG: hypothetical protein WBC51_17165 [Vicinamibacterales bacterium]